MSGLDLDLGVVRDFAIALLVGALIGLEREKRKAQDGDIGIGGLRTFMLLAETGAVTAWLSTRFATPWVLAAVALGISLIVTAGYVVQVQHKAASLGLTTEVAAVATFLLGALCLAGEPALAVALGIVTSAALAWKRPLHGLVAKLGEDDLYAGLKLLIASFIVLPLLPHEPIDPWGALRPYQLWLLVVLIASLSLVGYVAVRWLGAGRGTVVTGLFGGLVSSTAVTLTFARRSRDEGEGAAGADILATGLLLAWAVMFARVVAIAAVLYPPLIGPLIAPFAAMGAMSLGAAGFCYWRSRGEAPGGPVDVPLRNPFSLRSAVKFGLFFAAVLLAVEIARTHLSSQSLYGIAAVAGLTDVDAITLSMVSLARGGGDAVGAVGAITLASVANTIAKAAMCLVLGSAAFRARMGLAAALTAVAAAVTTWLR